MEEIDLSSDDDTTLFTDDEQVPVDKVNHEFSQHSKLKGVVREYTIFNDIHCYQYVKKKHGGKTRFRVNLTYLDHNPKRQFTLAHNWLITAAICAVISFLLVYLGWFSSVAIDRNLISILAALFITLFVITLMITLLRTSDRIFIVSRFGRVPVLEFINKNPDSHTFKQFMNTLTQQIIQTKQQAQLNTKDRLSLEIKELRRLMKENVISEPVYELAKKRIFRNPGFSD